MKELHVAVGVLKDSKQRILLSKRHASAHQGGLWEFPGGKLEPGETVPAALRREFKEELDIEVQQASPLIRIRHRYPDRAVLLDVYQVDRFSGSANGQEGQEVRWVDERDLPQYPFPEANLPIISAIRLPAHWPILNDESTDPKSMGNRFDHWVEQGVNALLIRLPLVSTGQFKEIVQPLCAKAKQRGVKLILNTEAIIAEQTGASGVHLNSRRLLKARKRPLDRGFWVGASCHNLNELLHAQQLGLDYAFLAPVCPTASHPGVQPLGWKTFETLVNQVNIPVYALGGMKPGDLKLARIHGAQGVAGISAFQR